MRKDPSERSLEMPAEGVKTARAEDSAEEFERRLARAARFDELWAAGQQCEVYSKATTPGARRA